MPSRSRSRSSDKHRAEQRRTAVSFVRVFKHLFMAGVYLPMIIISLVGLMDWREEDWVIVLMAGCFCFGAHVTWLSVRFSAWKKRQRNNSWQAPG